MKAVMISIKPYWVFLIIAKAMGWEIKQHKEIEVRKNYPKAEDWNKVAKIYCSKDKKSFDKIPEKYRPATKKFLGKVIGEFVCDRIDEWKYLPDGFVEEENEKIYYINSADGHATCLTYDEIDNYGKGKTLYGWHINDLVIYDEPKELFDFLNYEKCQVCVERDCFSDNCWICPNNAIVVRPPQSWCYVEDEE